MAQISNDILTAKFISLPGALVAAGYGLCASHNTLPALYGLPASTSTKIFAHVFNTGASIIVPLCAMSSAASIYLSYTLGRQNSRQRVLWGAAAVASLATLPWTRLVMFPGIQTLLAISQSGVEQARVEVSREHVALLKTWEWQNYVRAGMFLTAGLSGLYASVLV